MDNPDTELLATAEQLRAWFDQQHTDDVVLYDITAPAAFSLGALIIEHRRRATDDEDRAQWDAELRCVEAEQRTLDIDDRDQLITQQHTWLCQAHQHGWELGVKTRAGVGGRR